VEHDQKLLEELRTDFVREAVITAQFAHPNVVSLVGVVTAGWHGARFVTEIYTRGCH
jgi:hypothetical protein